MRSSVNPSVRYKVGDSRYDCWKLFVDNFILIFIKAQTMREANKNKSNFFLPMKKLKSFVALQYSTRVYGKSYFVNFVRIEKYGRPVSKETMSRALSNHRDLLNFMTKIAKVIGW